MARYSVAAAKDSFSELIDRARAGEEVVITRRGQVVAELCPPRAMPVGHDDIYERLAAFRASMPIEPIDSTQLIREMRDEGY